MNSKLYKIIFLTLLQFNLYSIEHPYCDNLFKISNSGNNVLKFTLDPKSSHMDYASDRHTLRYNFSLNNATITWDKDKRADSERIFKISHDTTLIINRVSDDIVKLTYSDGITYLNPDYENHLVGYFDPIFISDTFLENSFAYNKETRKLQKSFVNGILFIDIENKDLGKEVGSSITFYVKNEQALISSLSGATKDVIISINPVNIIPQDKIDDPLKWKGTANWKATLCTDNFRTEKSYITLNNTKSREQITVQIELNDYHFTSIESIDPSSRMPELPLAQQVKSLVSKGVTVKPK